MRKKLIIGMICLTAVLSSCGNSAKTIEGNVAAKENGSNTGENGGTNGSDASGLSDGSDTSGQKDDTESDQAGTAAGRYKGYAFVYDGVVIEMDADAATIVAQLGESASYFESPSCAFEGIDKIYTYASFELDTYPMDGKDYVSTVILKDDTVATPEGVGIGGSVAQMEAAYGTDWSDVDGMAVYEKDGTKLCFIFDGDSIISVEYRSTVING